MRQQQWDAFKNAAKLRPVAGTPLALIVDSPWIPGYLGIHHLDYYLDPDVWFRANLQVARDFPDVIPFPSWWIEYGMVIEPSAAGLRVSFFPDQPPGLSPALHRLEDVERLGPIDPWRDGFMALALHRYRREKQRIFDAGYTIPVVAARGPLCTASFVYGLDNLMTAVVEEPDGVDRLLAYLTEGTIAWLKAQAEATGPCVEAIFVLDDVPGLLSRRLYQRFAAPHLKRICGAFPPDWVKVYHNDAPVGHFLEDLPQTGFDVLNFSHKLDIEEALRRTAGRMCLMGNVGPLEPGVRGSPAEVKQAALAGLRKTGGRNTILSLGGGVSPGMPAENIRAMAEAVREFHTAGSAGGGSQ